MSREKKAELFRFPMKGIHRVGMKNEQPPETCFDAQNVRPFDMIEGRARGGSRPGLSKYSSARQSANRVQDLNYVTTISNSLVVGSLSRRTIIPVVVTNGVIGKFNTTAVTNATVSGNAALGNATQSPFAHSAELFQRLYYADGSAYKIYVGSNNAAIDWTPTSGSLPGDIANTIVCRLIEQWRGRIVLSGLSTDPHNWFMSKLGDPLDWNYAPTTVTEIDAVTGGTGSIGKVPDIINAIVPYSDDVVLFGCDHSIWMMSGDPQAGGRFDLVTNTVGMAFGRPYTQLPDGTLFFFSNRGSVYKMLPGGGRPESITRDNIDPLIVNTNLNTHLIRMAYDEQQEGVHLFITPLTAGTATHWYYDIRNNAWFKVVFGDTAYNPVSIMEFDGDAPGDRVILLGGNDGYIRKFDSTAYQDDGTAFTSFAVMGPIVADKGRYPTILTDLQFIMDDTSGTVVYELGVGDTAEAAISDFAATLTGEVDYANTTINIAAGKSYNQNPRTRGYFQYFKVGTTNASAPWAIEYIQASYVVVITSKGRAALTETIQYAGPDDPPSLNTTGLIVAYWAQSSAVTQSGGFATGWEHRQAGAATYPNISISGAAVAVANSDSNLNGKMTLKSDVGTSFLTDAASPIGPMDSGGGWISMAVYYSNAAVTNATVFTFRRGVTAWRLIGTMDTNQMTFRIQDSFGAGNTSSAANATLAHNTRAIISFGSRPSGGPWELWINNTEVISHNLSKFWDDVDDGVNTLTFSFGSSGNVGWRMGAFAVYTASSNSVMNSVRYQVQNAMATFYNTTLS